MASRQRVFVVSATGTQSSALARQLRSLGWEVHATTRNPSSPAAEALSSIGVRVSKGDWDSPSALSEAMAGCQFLFLNLFPDLADPPHELEQAKSILQIAKAAGVKHVVYSSGFSLEGPDPAGLAGAVRASKRNIEREVSSAGFEKWTILQPGYFMANFLAPKVAMYPGAAESGVFTLALLPDTQLPLIDHEDIARFAVAAFRDPDRFSGQLVKLAGDLLTVEDIMPLLSAAAGREIRATYLSAEEVEAQKESNPFLSGQLAARRMAEYVDMDRVKSWGLPLGSFTGFLEREKDAVRETYGSPN